MGVGKRRKICGAQACGGGGQVGEGIRVGLGRWLYQGGEYVGADPKGVARCCVFGLLSLSLSLSLLWVTNTRHLLGPELTYGALVLEGSGTKMT